jgi:hypothetical protein
MKQAPVILAYSPRHIPKIKTVVLTKWSFYIKPKICIEEFDSRFFNKDITDTLKS